MIADPKDDILNLLRAVIDQADDILNMLPKSGNSMSPWQLRLASLMTQMKQASIQLLATDKH